MTIVQIEYKKFSDWDEETQQKIIEKHWDINVDFEWYESTIDDFKEIAEKFGLDIDKIYFSGFSSQGDGACFTGRYCYKKGAVKSIKKDFPNFTELHEIVEALQKLQSESFYTISTYAEHRGRYYHSNCIDFETNISKGCATSCHIETFEQVLKDFADLIYKTLEKEYYFLTSSEQVAETLINNEYEFNAKRGIL